ncbi:serine/threonine-protein phosphatase 7 long form homolog [Apium graveolens]|uniref:serine/threonine-protein phosphatase 7 long form homolog n=1 Tax=Apium graveolens TaxID=4045 RepID=UPI003D7B453C
MELQSTGFYGVARVASIQIDCSLISALIERWQPETHTFHLPMGDVTITLQDVGILLGFHVDGDTVISDVTPGADMSWHSYVAELFGKDPDPKKDMNGTRIWLTFISSCAPPHLSQDASADDIRFQVLCYLVHLVGGVLFTDHSEVSSVAIEKSVTELCKKRKKDVDEVAGCLLLLQLWAWERLPTLAPINTSVPLFDARFWEGQLAAPRGLRWLYGHSYTSTGGRSLPVIRKLLDGLDYLVELHCPDRVSRQFGLVQTILVDVVYSEAEHSTNLRGNDKIRWIQKHAASISIWVHRLDHIFIGDAIVAGSAVPEYHPWYLERNVRFISRVGAFNHRIDLMFRQISERTQDVLPDVSHFADQCCDFLRECGGARAAAGRRARVPVDDDPVATDLGDDHLPLYSDSHDVPESSTQAHTDPMATDLGDDLDPPIRNSVADTVSVHMSRSSSHF